jgi:hypothetical protein
MPAEIDPELSGDKILRTFGGLGFRAQARC